MSPKSSAHAYLKTLFEKLKSEGKTPLGIKRQFPKTYSKSYFSYWIELIDSDKQTPENTLL